jgi:hypothetical protein
MNIFPSNKCVASYAIVDIDKCAETRVNIHVQMFECWITVMTLYYIYLVMCIPDESLSRPQSTVRRIEGGLWNLKHRRIRENFVAYDKRIEKKKSKNSFANYMFNIIYFKTIVKCIPIFPKCSILLYFYSNLF